MQKKLTIVVTCTDRKSATPSPDLQFRNLRRQDLEGRVRAWRHALDNASIRHPLRSLYQGATWTQVATLELAAERAGFQPHLLIASAGLGMVDAGATAPAYSATFSSGHPDSVSGTTLEAQRWWKSISRPDPAVDAALAYPTLLVLSKTYADAMAPDLALLSARDDVVVFGGSDAIASSMRVRADRGLCRALGGTATSLNLRAARAWIELLPDSNLAHFRNHEAWTSWAARERQIDLYDRTPLSDDAVVAFVRDLRSADPSISRSRALRLLRSSGHACEQKRFARLFVSTLEAM